MNKNIKKAVVGLVAFNVIASTMITAMPTQSKGAEVSPVVNTKLNSQANLTAKQTSYLTSIGVTSGVATISGNSVTLSNYTYFAAGGLMTKEKVNLLHDFKFTSTLGFGGGNADGISFVMQNNASPSVFGGNGDGLGLSGLRNAVGIAMRAQTFYTPSRQNVSFYANNQFFDAKNTVGNLTGTAQNVTITWTAATRTLSYTIAGISSSYQVADLTATFGGTKAYIGLVGVTGQGANVHVADSPKIEFDLGAEPAINATDQSLLTGQPFSPLAGITATDAEDGDLTNAVKVTENDVDTSKVGVYHVTYSVTDSDGNVVTKTIAVTVANLPAPTMTPVTDRSTSITVTGDSASDITIVLPDGTRITKKADTSGKAVFPVSNLVANQEVKAYQSQYDKSSDMASQIVTAIAAAPPTIAPFTTADTNLVVTGEPGAKITVSLPDGTDLSRTAGADGKATFNIGTQDLGAVIEATQTGSNGKASAPASITVAQGVLAAPTVNSVTTDSTTVTGTGIAGATVQIKINDILYKGTVKSDGTYSITIPKQTAGSRILANQIYNDVVSASVGAFVTQGKVAAPTINALTTDDTTVTGTGIADASVKVKANNIEYTGTVKADGTYSITIPKQAANTVVTATQTLYNVTSSAVSTTVTDKAVVSTLTAGDFTIGADNYIKGTYTGDIAKLAIEVNGTLQQTINATGSPYQYYAKGKVNAATDQVYVIGYDATGKQLQKTKVNVKQQTVGTITPNTFYIGSENYVTGKLSGNVAKFSMTVNGVEYSKINVTTAPDFKYYANNLITNVTDVVKVNAYDASGKLLDSKPVSVTTYQGEEGKITSVAPFKLGKDSYVTGAYTGDVKKVELQVNGVALQRINVTGGTIKYYAKANITKTTDEVKLVGYNTAGVAVSTKTISVSAADGTVTANPFVIGKDGYVTGKYTGDVAKISLTVNGVKQTTINVPAGSDYQYYAKTLIKNASDVVVLTAYDAVGGVLDTANVAVSDSKATTSGTVTPSAFKLGTDAYVDGTYTGDVAKVELEVNDVKYGQIPATGNTIHYYAASLITNASDVVKVNVYDTAGKQLDSKTVSVVAPTGNVTATTVKVGDSYLRGTATGDVTKVAVSVNGTVQTSVAFVQPDGSYQYYIKNLNLKATDDVKVIGMDARGNTINTSNVTITN
ncbi:DUF5011 domain-containing protein [Listeria booriae]|uniref:immunoglobulin-like domain-containing protein n=1 Tax=Listeria booriae TaxID=1552123 RepID=UPI0016281F75|nr:immunoglobulin-like domain-containing protein [Listeria booriae]MBC1651492.1 DUF5011 domain-containing protein [Listeria booriae]